MKPRDTSEYEILYDLPKGEYAAAEIGGIRTRTFRAGDVIEVECFPLTRISAEGERACRARKKQRACQEALNRRNAEKRMRRYIDANFTGEDWVLTLTWDYGQIDRFTMSAADADRLFMESGLPLTEEDAKKALNNFYRRAKGRMRRMGENPADLKHLYVQEITQPKVGGFEHYHFHLVLHAPGLSDMDLKALWPHGFARADRFSARDEGAARLASYLTKQHTTEAVDRDGKRMRRWGHSKNLIMPEDTVSDRKISRRRAAKIAEAVERDGCAIFEQCYPGYRCVATPTVRYSQYVPGAYIFARMRRVDAAPPWVRAGKKRRGDESMRPRSGRRER